MHCGLRNCSTKGLTGSIQKNDGSMVVADVQAGRPSISEINGGECRSTLRLPIMGIDPAKASRLTDERICRLSLEMHVCDAHTGA